VPGPPSGGSGIPFLVLLSVAILAGFWFFLARRRRRRPDEGLAPEMVAPLGSPRPPLPAAMIVPPKPDKPKRSRAPKVDVPSAPLALAFAATSADAIPAAPTAALAEPYGEALMPRWRRPSLKTARYASPRIAPEPVAALTFATGATAGLERRLVRYDLVALTDIPDEIRGAQVGQLQANDEVEVTGRKGAWVRVRTPLGTEGWIHRTTLQATDDAPDAIASAPPPAVLESPATPFVPDSIEAEVAMGAFAAATAAAAARAHTLDLAQTTAAVAEPPTEGKPAKRPRTRRPATPKPAPKTVRAPKT
jgi:hypothetical protein